MIIETASIQTRSYGEEVIARAPDHVRAAINRKRVKSGMAPVLSVRDYERLDQERRAAEVAAVEAERRSTGVWIERSGRLVPVKAGPARGPTTSRSTATTKSRGPLVDRVLIVATYGDAPSANVRGGLPETIAHNAFGPAATLNAERGWILRAGHDGPCLATAGERLRAHDTPAGLVVEWLPDLSTPWAADAVRAIEAGHNATSVGMVVRSSRTSRLPKLTKMITDARLLHVALLGPGSSPAYPGARAKVFRSSWRDDADELRRQIDEVLERARWFDRQAGR